LRGGGDEVGVGFCPSLNIGPRKPIACDGYNIANGDASAVWKYGNRVAVAVGVWAHKIFVCDPGAGCMWCGCCHFLKVPDAVRRGLVVGLFWGERGLVVEDFGF
jgi:hypothetical protein